MSYARRNLFRVKLNHLLERADDEDFFKLVWATHALQTGRADKIGNLISFPPEAETSQMNSPYAVHPWRLETLLNEVLTTPKLALLENHKNRRLNCRQFQAMISVNNALLSLENAEDSLTLRRVCVLKEIHRLGQRQFEWQRGLISAAQLYRSAFIYGGDISKKFFGEANGFSLSDFRLACFALWALFLNQPSVPRNFVMNEIGIAKTTLDLIFDLIAIPHSMARKRASNLRSDFGHTGYKRSLFREYPCVAFGEGNHSLLAPLPDLLTLRATSGLFYDLVKGDDKVKNEISGRFETYCLQLLQHMLPSYTVAPSYKYSHKKNKRDTPDIVISKDNLTALVIECKATRMSYEARYSENPVTDAQRGYQEIAKGVFQIWRFVSHARRGIIKNLSTHRHINGIVLTWDTWLSMANDMQAEVVALARKMAEKEFEISEDDQIPVIFCPIEDLEATLHSATEDSFFHAIQEATKANFLGWQLSSVHREIAPNIAANNTFPFHDKMTDLLPWWGEWEKEKS